MVSVNVATRSLDGPPLHIYQQQALGLQWIGVFSTQLVTFTLMAVKLI